MNKIKILMVMGNTRRGGVQSFILNNLEKLDKDKFQVDFAINEDFNGGWGPFIRSLGCKIHIVPYFNIVNWIQFEAAWEKLLSENDYDIIHGNSTNSAFIYLRIAKRHGLVTISHMHNIGFRGNLLQRIPKKFFSRFASKHADYWFACSDDAAKILYGDKYKSYKNYYEIPNAIDVQKFRFNESIRNRIREELHIENDEILYGHVGTFSRQKNHSFLIEVFDEILKRNPCSKLILIGEGSFKNSIIQKATNLGIIDRIIFKQNIGNVNEYMMAMDAFIFPSLYEGFGIVALESQVAGLYTVISDTVPRTIMLSDAVKSLSLDDSSSKWADVCVSLPNQDRLKLNDTISKTPYNLDNTSSLLTRLYTEMYNNK